MKQDIVEYVVDSFIDFNGSEHKIVACALSQAAEKCEDGYKLSVGWANEDNGDICVDDPDFFDICRVVSVGISVCHPTDTFDLELGKKNAYNKALHDPKCSTIYTRDRGVAGKHLVKAFMEQEISYLKENPERYIKGYNKMKERFDNKEAIKSEIANLNEASRDAIRLAMDHGVDLTKCAKLIKRAKQAKIKIDE